MSKIQEVVEAVESGKVKLITNLVQKALDAGVDPEAILNEGMIGAMADLGAKYQANELALPEMLVATKTIKTGIEILKPHLSSDSMNVYGSCIIGSVAGDLHDVEKSLAALLIECSGFKVIDLGTDVPAKKFIEAIKINPDCKVVCAFALLTTSMDTLKNTVLQMIAAGCKSQVKIMVGGAHVTQAYADEIGADAFIPDIGAAAVKAVELVKQEGSHQA